MASASEIRVIVAVLWGIVLGCILLLVGCTNASVRRVEDAPVPERTRWSLERIATAAKRYRGEGDGVRTLPPEEIDGPGDLEYWITDQAGFFSLYEFTSPDGKDVIVLCSARPPGTRGFTHDFSVAFFVSNRLMWTFHSLDGELVPVVEQDGISIWSIGGPYLTTMPWEHMDWWLD